MFPRVPQKEHSSTVYCHHEIPKNIHSIHVKLAPTLVGKAPLSSCPAIAAGLYVTARLGLVDQKSYEAWRSNICLSQVVEINGKPCHDNKTAFRILLVPVDVCPYCWTLHLLVFQRESYKDLNAELFVKVTFGIGNSRQVELRWTHSAGFPESQ